MKVTLRAARVNRNLTLSEAAKALNVGERTLSYWENGKSSPRADKMAKICRLYECTPNDIIFLPDDCGLTANDDK